MVPICNLMVHFCIQEIQFQEREKSERLQKSRMTLMYHVVCKLKIEVIYGILLGHCVLLLVF